MFCDNVFLVVAADIGYIAYKESDSNKEETILEWTMRNFFVKSRIIWAETTTEQKGVVLIQKPISELDKINWIKTENNKDLFGVKIGSNEASFSFGFNDQVNTDPKIRINEMECFGTLPKIKKLILASSNVLEVTMENLDVFHLVTPKFVFVEDSQITHITFFVYHDLCYETDGEKLIDHDYDVIFYPLDKSEIFFKMEVGGEDPFLVSFIKVLEHGHLYFKTEVGLDSLGEEEYELPLYSDGSHPELSYVYTYMRVFLHWNANGVLANLKQKEDRYGNSSGAKNNSRFLGKQKNIVVVLLVSVCLLFSLFFVFWFKRIYFKKKKKRFHKA